MTPPTVTVVINTLNRVDRLANALRALKGLDYSDFEVVVVNGPSTDSTEALLSAWSGDVRVERCAEANLSMSRNIGIAAAAGEIVAFMDDDAAPHPQWLTKLVAAFSDPAVGGAGGYTIDHTGAAFQARKTVCDRFGGAYAMSSFFDERPLNRPGLAYYPSLLGTNCAFRADALRGIGGFDHAFAYFLDETDVCLRLVDAGWKLLYAPEALVFHQYAESHIRDPGRVPRTLYPSSVSKAYFIQRHGAPRRPAEAGQALGRFRTEILAANDWLEREGRIGPDHRRRLDRDLHTGIEAGIGLAAERAGRALGDLGAAPAGVFRPFPNTPGALRIAMVSQGFPPEGEAGIARWSTLAARGLAARGHHVHVLTRTSAEETVAFEDGVWLHRMRPDPAAGPAMGEALGIPSDLGAWCARVWREAQALKAFGLDVLSFPIWDLEGLAAAQDPELATVVSLHTTYAMAKPFKPEWNTRPLLERRHVDPVIAAEGRLLATASRLVANSEAVMNAIEDLYGVDVRPRSTLVPHGVPDPMPARAGRAAEREAAVAAGEALRVLFAGRFEARKGFDIAAAAAAALMAEHDRIEAWFVGEDLSEPTRSALRAAGPEGWEDNDRVRFLGEVERAALEDLFVEADLILVPSRFESFGLVGIEAMAAGKPVLTLAVGGLAEIVEPGVTGLTFAETPEVARDIADAIIALDGDRPRLLALGRAGRARYLQAYTVEAMAEGLEAAYAEAAAARRSAAA